MHASNSIIIIDFSIIPKLYKQSDRAVGLSFVLLTSDKNAKTSWCYFTFTLCKPIQLRSSVKIWTNSDQMVKNWPENWPIRRIVAHVKWLAYKLATLMAGTQL
jgi:hypothetical protein